MGTAVSRFSWVEWDARMAIMAWATRSFSQSVVGTVLWTAIGPSAPFLVGGTVKIAYDLTLWWMFRRVKPPEEVAGG